MFFAFYFILFIFRFFSLVADELHEIFVEDMSQRIAETENLPPVYPTVVRRCQIAIQFHDMAREEYRLCEDMVHDQHLQMQGWSAVIANLDDITVDITKRVELFKRNLAEFLEERNAYVKLVERFVRFYFQHFHYIKSFHNLKRCFKTMFFRIPKICCFCLVKQML